MYDSDMRLAWVDTETSGLEADRDRIIEIAVLVTDGDLNELDSYEQKIRLSPTDRLAASPKALEINGYNDTDWAQAPLPSKEIWERVQDMTAGRILAGQNVTLFDSKFIAAEMLRFGLRPKWDRRMADTMEDSIRVMHAYDVRHPKTGKPTAGLEFVYDTLGGPSMPAHRAMADVRRAIFVYRTFDEAFRRSVEDRRPTKPGQFAGEFGDVSTVTSISLGYNGPPKVCAICGALPEPPYCRHLAG